jgi:hypothetical protein
MGKFSSVQFFQEFSEPGTGPEVQFRHLLNFGLNLRFRFIGFGSWFSRA